MLENCEITLVEQAKAFEMDQCLFDKYLLKSSIAMELAGQAVANSIVEYLKTEMMKEQAKILILCGPGNNGGDGLVCARHLMYLNPEIEQKLLLMKMYQDPHKESLFKNLQFFDNISFHTKEELSSIKYSEFDLIIDCLFGFSFKGPIRQSYQKLFQNLQDTTTNIFSVDIPSGWDVNQGNKWKTFTPSANISLGCVKKCMNDF